MLNDDDKTEREKMRIDIDDILKRVDLLPMLDDRTPDEIIGYDESGTEMNPAER